MLNLKFVGFLIFALQLSCLKASGQHADAYRKFYEGFQNPPAKAHPLV